MVKETERQQTRAVLWVFWGGLLVSTAGEGLLFAMMEATGAISPIVAAAVLGPLAVGMLAAASATGHTKFAGGGVPTALITWLLFKGISILGLVAYQLAATHWLFFPFVATYLAGMAWWHPGRFRP